MGLKYFFGAEGASIAFQKLQDFADWTSSIYEAGAETTWAADPTLFTDAEVMDVANLAGVVVVFKRSSGAATFNFRVIGGTASTNFANTFFTLDGGDYTVVANDLLIAVSTTGIDYLAIVVDSITAGTLECEIAPVPYEVTV